MARVVQCICTVITSTVVMVLSVLKSHLELVLHGINSTLVMEESQSHAMVMVLLHKVHTGWEYDAAFFEDNFCSRANSNGTHRVSL